MIGVLRTRSGAGLGLSVLSLLVITGCSAVRLSRPIQSATPSGAAQLVARADALARDGDDRSAQFVYQQVVREFPADSAAADALYRLGCLQSDPMSSVQNYRAAYMALTQLAMEYPGSRWAHEARAWQAMLGELIAHEEDAIRTRQQLRRREEELGALKLQMQQLSDCLASQAGCHGR